MTDIMRLSREKTQNTYVDLVSHSLFISTILTIYIPETYNTHILHTIDTMERVLCSTAL